MERSKRRALAIVLAVAGLAVVFGAGPAGATSKTFIGCGSTVYSNYTFPADLSCSDTTALYVGSDGITINLNGHSLTDTAGGDDGEVGIDTQGHSKVTIKGGTIANFWAGVYTDEDPNLLVQNMTILLDGNNNCDFDTYGIYLNYAYKAKIKNVTITNSGDPVMCGDYNTYGVYSGNGDMIEVSKSTANNVFRAFYDYSGYYDKWSQNTANSPFDTWNDYPATGFFDFYGWGNSYSSNTANGGTTGFFLDSSGNYVKALTGNTANNNSRDGAYMYASNEGPATIVSGNTFSGNGNDGMHGAYNYGMAFTGNTANGNGANPACCGSYGNGFNFWSACSATFSKNTAGNNSNSGFRLGGWCGSETAKANVANNNGNDGFTLNSNDTCTGSFLKNKAFGNGDAGAQADNFFVPGTKNLTDTYFDGVNVANFCET